MNASFQFLILLKLVRDFIMNPEEKLVSYDSYSWNLCLALREAMFQVAAEKFSMRPTKLIELVR